MTSIFEKALLRLLGTVGCSTTACRPCKQHTLTSLCATLAVCPCICATAGCLPSQSTARHVHLAADCSSRVDNRQLSSPPSLTHHPLSGDPPHFSGHSFCRDRGNQTHPCHLHSSSSSSTTAPKTACAAAESTPTSTPPRCHPTFTPTISQHPCTTSRSACSI